MLNVEKTRIDKINYYLDIAETVIERATCLRRNFGAIIVKNDEDSHLMAIADGMGGHSAGEVASSIAINYLGEHFKESFRKIDEDLFYRINENNKEKKFIPSEKEIIISFPNVKLIINEKGE